MITTKRKILKRVISVAVCLTFMFSMSVTAFAGSYTPKTERCPKCGKFNNSYGYEPNLRSTSVELNGGKYCEPCGKVIPAGDYHFYIYSSDKYYFMCNSANCSNFNVPDRVYYNYYANPASTHYTNGVKDY